MRQTLLLNILLLGLLVALFCSVYAKRPLLRVRLWIVGWLWTLLHFSVSLWEPKQPVWSHLADALGVSFLMLCGISFLFSTSRVKGLEQRQWLVWSTTCIPLCFVWCDSYGIQAPLLLVALNLAGHCMALVLLWTGYPRRYSIAIPGTVLMLVCSHWLLFEITLGHEDDCVSILLMELFALYALFFAHDFARYSAGVLATVGGLLLWAAVFPVGMLQMCLWPNLVIDPEIWNVPKIIVAFGMLVTLFEDEVLLAQREQEQYQRLFDRAPLPMWIFDRYSLNVLGANGAALREFGWGPSAESELVVTDLLSRRPDGEPVESPVDWRGALGLDLGEGGTIPARFRRQNGTEVLVELALEPVDFHGREARLLLAQDVTEKMQIHEQLIHQANHDPLTGLPNRLLLHDRMKNALAAAERRGTRAAVFCIDLDRFKAINDTMGHAAGDSCLREIANRLRSRLRSIDTIARIGGEEFIIVLDDLRTLRDAERVAQDLLFNLGSPHTYDGKQIQLSASVGIALYPDDADQPGELWRMADAAMYRAKQAGGNRHRFFNRGELKIK